MSSSYLRAVPVALVFVTLLIAPAFAARKQAAATHNVSVESVNNAEWRAGNLPVPFLVKLQVLKSPPVCRSQFGEYH